MNNSRQKASTAHGVFASYVIEPILEAARFVRPRSELVTAIATGQHQSRRRRSSTARASR